MVLERRLDRPKWPRFFVICVLKGILVKMEPALIPIVLVFIFHFYQNAYRIYIYIYIYIYISIHSKYAFILWNIPESILFVLKRYRSSKAVEGTTFSQNSL